MAPTEAVGLKERWDRCREDPECRARLFRAAIWMSILYTAVGFVLILMLLTGIIEL
jgi:hypothetical protein